MASSVETFSEKIISILTGESVNPGAANYYLEAMYGTWITGNDGTYTLVTSTFSIINLLAFALSVIIFFAAFVGGISKTALTGEVMGKNWGQDLLPVKMFIGVVMMMPILVDNHVSLSQRMGMNLLLMGSAAGDYTWRKAVDDAYMNIGSNTTPSSFIYTARKITKSAACAAALVNGRGQKEQPLLTIKTSGNSRANVKRYYRGSKIKSYQYGDNSSYFYAYDRDGRSFETIRELSNEFRMRNGSSSEPKIESIEFGDKGECGSISFKKLLENKVEQTESMAFDKRVQLIEYNIAKSNFGNTISYVVNSIDIAFEAIRLGYEDFERADEYDASEMDRQAVNSIKKKVAKNESEYVRRSQQNIARQLERDKRKNANILDEAKEPGWIYAGAWIMQLGRITKIVPTAVKNSVSSTYSSPTQVCENLFSSNDDDCSMAHDIRVIPQALVNYESEIDSYFSQVTNSIESCAKDTCNNDEIRDSMSSYIASEILNILRMGGNLNYNYNLYEGDGSHIIGIDEESARDYSTDFGLLKSENPIKDASGLANPFATLIQLGHGLLNFSYIAELAMIQPAMVAEKISSGLGRIPGLGGFSKYVETIIELLLLKLFGLYAAFMLLGVMLAYLLPVLPVVRWLGPALGFLVVSLEFHAVAPLAMMLLLIPEGSGIVGTQLMSVIRYLAAVLLRPTLTIMGLVSGYVASYVVFGLFNGLFWKGFGLNTGASVFEIIITIYLYAFIGYQILDKLYALSINLVRDILRWISPGNEPFGDAAFGQINIDPQSFGNVASIGFKERMERDK